MNNPDIVSTLLLLWAICAVIVMMISWDKYKPEALLVAVIVSPGVMLWMAIKGAIMFFRGEAKKGGR